MQVRIQVLYINACTYTFYLFKYVNYKFRYLFTISVIRETYYILLKQSIFLITESLPRGNFFQISLESAKSEIILWRVHYMHVQFNIFEENLED